MTVGTNLTMHVGHLAEYVYGSSPLFLKTKSGELTPQEVGTYLYNLKFMLSQTPQHIELGCRRARELGQSNLEGFLDQKLREEIGHDAWAEDDLMQLTHHGLRREDLELCSSILSLDCFILERTNHHPIYYVVYALWAEHLTVLLVPRWAAALELKCNIHRSSITVLTKHLELDENHVKENINIIDDIADSDKSIKELELMDFLQEVTRRYVSFGEQIVRQNYL